MDLKSLIPESFNKMIKSTSLLKINYLDFCVEPKFINEFSISSEGS